MPELRSFLLDANVFIEAKRRYYAFDICPGFWECLVWHHAESTRVLSIDRVKRELERGGDDLRDWVALEAPSTCFASTGHRSVVDCYKEIIAWVHGEEQFSSAAKAAFAAGADGWLVAYAKAENLILVTHETYAPEARGRVPIPNVCAAFDVDYADTFEMLRELEAAFSWGPSS